MEHDPQPSCPLGLRRRPERCSCLDDLLLRPADPLRHRGLGHEEGAGDLGGGETGDRPQRQGQLGRRRQRRMAAEEQQRQRVVGGRHGFGPGHRRIGLFPPSTGLVAAQLVDQPARRHRHQPCLRARRPALGRPLHAGRDERFLHGVLARVEVAVAPHEHGEHFRRQPADQRQVVVLRHHTSKSASISSGFTSTPT